MLLRCLPASNARYDEECRSVVTVRLALETIFGVLELYSERLKLDKIRKYTWEHLSIVWHKVLFTDRSL